MKPNNRTLYTSALRGSRYLYFGIPSTRTVFAWILASFVYVRYAEPPTDSRIFFASRTASKRKDLVDMQQRFLAYLDQPLFVAQYSIKPNLLFPIDLLNWSVFYFTHPDDFTIKPRGLTNRIASFFCGLHTYSSIRRITIKARQAFVFCDSVGLDASIAAIHKEHGAHVTCIQHGQYRYEPTTINSDLIPFLNACGSRILAWGDATLAEFQRADIKDYDVVIAGRFSSIPPLAPQVDSLSGLCVVLNGPDSSYVNHGLIAIAEKFSAQTGIHYTIKRHPADANTYLAPDFEPTNTPTTLFLCHSSGFIIESLLCRRRVALLKDKYSPRVYSRISSQVTSADDLVRLFQSSTPEFWSRMYDRLAVEFVANV